MTFRSTSSLRTLTFVLGLGLATACSPVFRDHGYAPTEDELSQIIVGVDTNLTVEETFGPPTTSGVLSDNAAYYVESRWRHFGAMRPKPIEREVVAFSYDNDGVIINIERFALEDGKVVRLSKRVTEGGRTNISFLRQLLGSVGRVSAETLVGGP